MPCRLVAIRADQRHSCYPVSNRIPYTEQYMVSIERQLGDNTVFSASYVGNQSHRLLVLVESNPGNPALCLSLSQPSQVAAGSATCGLSAKAMFTPRRQDKP